jgi:ribose transport system permease protein
MAASPPLSDLNVVAGNPSRRFALRIGEFGWIWFATVGVFVISAIVAPGSVRSTALLTMLPFAGILAIVAVGQTLVIQQRGLDMSAPGMITLSGILVASWGYDGHSVIFAIPLVLITAAAIGIANGYLVTRANIAPIVATLATNALMLGAVRAISGGTPLSSPALLTDFSHRRLLGLPYGLLLALVFIVVLAIVTKNTSTGRKFVAAGVNPLTTLAAGINVRRYQIGSYMIAALCFSVAGMVYAGFIGNASNSAGDDYLLPGIAAVVVGGTPLNGGRGSVVASGIAALFITQLGQLVLALGATASTQLLLQALAIVVATTIRYLPALRWKWRSRTGAN